MQTFLPYPDFAASARVLDRQRLGKQRMEAFQLLEVLRGVPGKTGWRNHPAALMWKGHENSLVQYGLAICDEWIGRGYKDTMRPRIAALQDPGTRTRKPRWFGDPSFHAAHRGNLLRKDPVHYGQFGWTESPELPYLWPSADGKTVVTGRLPDDGR